MMGRSARFGEVQHIKNHRFVLAHMIFYVFFNFTHNICFPFFFIQALLLLPSSVFLNQYALKYVKASRVLAVLCFVRHGIQWLFSCPERLKKSSCRSVGRSVGPSVHQSVGEVCEKVTLRTYPIFLPTYLPTYLPM